MLVSCFKFDGYHMCRFLRIVNSVVYCEKGKFAPISVFFATPHAFIHNCSDQKTFQRIPLKVLFDINRRYLLKLKRSLGKWTKRE